MKLYPPVIDNKLPAFYGNSIKVPFKYNRAISKNDICGAKLLIKSVSSKEVLTLAPLKQDSSWIGIVDKENQTIDFPNIRSILTNTNSIQTGQFYKIQIAFVNNFGEVGYWSNAAIVKYINQPLVKIEGLSNSNQQAQTNIFKTYVGVYKLKNENIISEPLYSYYFNLYDDNNIIIDTSGIILNNATETEEDGFIRNIWSTNKELKPYHNYYIEYGITTLNGCETKTRKYKIQNSDTIDLDIDADFIAKLDYENGCINISLTPDSKFNDMIKYKFLISRASDKDNYTSWEPLFRDEKAFNFILKGVPDLHIWTDYTIEHGVSYIYSLQAYNDYGIYSNRIYSNRIKIKQQELENLLNTYNNTLINIKTLRSENEYDIEKGKEIGIIFKNKYLSFAKKIGSVDGNLYVEIFNLISQMEKGILIYNHQEKLLQLEYCLQLIEPYLLKNNKDIYGIPIPILANFEYAYLSDGQRQLKIAFNPKVSTFKNTVLESKIDTLGGKYPFFFRNGKVKYKEFPVSGLISCLMDKDDKFLTDINQKVLYQRFLDGRDIELDDGIGETQLTTTNIWKEKQFKIEVLEWLQNGQPKIFRSPTEGNFIVRLMNTSLTPNDTLGRMLHTFSTIAYEIADYTFDNLLKYDFINIDLKIIDNLFYVCQRELPKEENGEKTIYFSTPPEQVKCSLSSPAQGDGSITITYRNGSKTQEIKFFGDYIFPESVCKQIASITLNTTEPIYITWVYKTEPPSNNFNYIKNIILSEEHAQFIGGGIIEDFQLVDIVNNKINNVEREIGKILYLKIQRRHIEDCWLFNGKYYEQASHISEESFNYAETLIYRVFDEDNGIIYYTWRNPDSPKDFVRISEQEFKNSQPYTIILNGETFSLEQNEITFTNSTIGEKLCIDEEYMQKFPMTTETVIDSNIINDINELKVGCGLNVEIGYNIKHYEYDLKDSVLYNQNINNKYQLALKEKNNSYEKLQKDFSFTNIQKYKIAYQNYLEELKTILEDLKNPE